MKTSLKNNLVNNVNWPTKCGVAYKLCECVFVYCKDSIEEPFKYIELPKQLEYKEVKAHEVFYELYEYKEYDYIQTLKEWRQAKINRYIELQNDKEQEKFIRSIHYSFIDELASIYHEDKDSLIGLENIKDILFLDSKGDFYDASEMTEGSIYNPFCDFQKYSLEYRYISNSYKEECSNDIRKMLNNVFKIHCDFKKEDIKNLSNREFSIYFWSQYLLRQDADISGIKRLIEDRHFDSVSCIPTKDYMKKPDELYAMALSHYLKHIEDGENKYPLSALLGTNEKDKGNIKTLFDILLNKPCNKSLSFVDATFALFSVGSKERRKELLKWMVDSKEEKKDSIIEKYREDESAKWKNVKNVDQHIKNLYALPNDNKQLNQYFGNLPKIINKDYLPDKESFKAACNVLKIKIIEAEDIIVDPQNQVSKDEDYKNYLKICALTVAGTEDSEKWAERYHRYSDRIDKMKLLCCSAISIKCKEDDTICANLKKFYHKSDTNEFFFVKSLHSPIVLRDFIDSFIDYLDFICEKDVVNTIMESEDDAIKWAMENNTLMIDEAFKEEMKKLRPGIKLKGIKADDEDDIATDTFHTLSGYDDTDYDDESTDDIEDDDESTDDIEDDIETPNIDEYDNSIPNKTRHSRNGQGGARGMSTTRTYYEPKPYSRDDVRAYGSHGITRSLDTLEPTKAEIDEINRILGEDLSPERIADQNYLVQLRLYYSLKDRGLQIVESKEEFIRNSKQKEHQLVGNRYIHKCSAQGGIMYLSPSIWNKIADDRCVVCVYYGPKANEFMYFNSIEDILKWIKEDDIVIKLTGKERVDVVNTLYSGVLRGVKGTAYTLIRIKSNEKYNSLFAAMPGNNSEEQEESEEDYG